MSDLFSLFVIPRTQDSTEDYRNNFNNIVTLGHWIQILGRPSLPPSSILGGKMQTLHYGQLSLDSNIWGRPSLPPQFLEKKCRNCITDNFHWIQIFGGGQAFPPSSILGEKMQTLH